MTVDSARLPKIGLIVPPAAGKIPDDGPMLYGERAQFMARGLALSEMSSAGYEAVIDSVADQATSLAQAGAKVISLMGTSLSFYRGAAFNRRLSAAILDATGLPATTMSSAVIRALHVSGVRRVAVATAYIDDVNHRLVGFLREEGIEVTAIKGLAMTDVIGVGTVTPAILSALARAVFAEDRSAQGVLISCGGLRTLDILDPLETDLQVPIISSSPAGFWDVVRLAGIDPTVPGFGRLFRLSEGRTPAAR